MTLTVMRDIMSDKGDVILEELLLTETSLEEEEDSTVTELEILLGEEDEAEENGLFIDTLKSLGYANKDCLYKLQHSFETGKKLFLIGSEENNDFENMEDFHEESRILAQVLSDGDEDDDEIRDASIDTIHNKHSYLSALKRAGRREQKHRVKINSNQLGVNEPLYVYINTCIYMFIHTFLFTYTYLHIYIYMCIYINICI
jgi:hypothetical protein